MNDKFQSFQKQKKKQKEKIKEVEGNKSYDSFRKTVA